MVAITIYFPAVDARYGQVDAVAVRKLHQIAYELGKVLFKKLGFIGALADEDFAEIFIIGFFLARSKIAHEVHNVKKEICSRTS